MRRCRALLLCVLPLLAVPATAQDAPQAASQAAAPRPVCDTAEHRQFDFWLGDWEVSGGPGLDRVVGHNTITRVSTGCALHEHWVDAGGSDGHSLNTYDREAKRWTQFWVGSGGVILHLAGGLREDGAMAMEGTLPNGSGGQQRQRIVWTPQPDGSVVQQWDTSDDDGKTWVTAFVGHYRQKLP